ncbi:MAG TPA: microcystin degradation protein MlrC, partial [Porphyromonadaceae bacterium]|nr:microcystin degradation protein MlrC [Porphyromonadaceae bacterium]
MKKIVSITFIIAVLSAMFAGCNSKKSESDLPRIAIAGIAIESSTFSPAVSHEEAFKTRVGDSVFTYYPFFA